MVYLISYDLRAPGRDYSNLISEIKSLGSWAKPLESLWLVETTLDTQTVVSRLNALDLTDRLLVIHVSTPWRSVGLDQEVVDWMKRAIS